MRKDGQLVSLGEISADATTYFLALGPRGICCANSHWMYVYEPDFEKECMVVKDGVEDNVVNNLCEHDGYVRIRDGEAEPINEEEYMKFRNRYTEAQPIGFRMRP